MKSHIHIDAELFAAWSDGTLPKDEAARVDEHLADCSSCQEMLAVFARTEPPAAPAVPGFPRVSGAAGARALRWRWAIPIAAAATVAAIWVAVPEDERTAKLNPTAAPLSEPAATPGQVPSADAAASQEPGPDQGQRQEPKAVAPLRAARSDSIAENATKETPARKTEQSATRSAPEARERDQDLKVQAPQPAAAAAAAAAAPPAPSPALDRLEQSSRLRAASAEVVSPDPLVRWRIVPPGRLERTTDGGKTWVPVVLPDQAMVTSVAAPTAATAIVATSDGRQFQTADQGKTWNPVIP